MAAPPANVRYMLLSARGIAWPLAICTGALAALPFVSGLPLAIPTRPPETAPSSQSVQRYSREVYVANAVRGCRWQHSNDPLVQIADCGDEGESVRVIFHDGRISEYRVTARRDPLLPVPAGQGTSGSTASAQQPSQPGRVLPGAVPIRVTPRAGS